MELYLAKPDLDPQVKVNVDYLLISIDRSRSYYAGLQLELSKKIQSDLSEKAATLGRLGLFPLITDCEEFDFTSEGRELGEVDLAHTLQEENLSETEKAAGELDEMRDPKAAIWVRFPDVAEDSEDADETAILQDSENYPTLGAIVMNSQGELLRGRLVRGPWREVVGFDFAEAEKINPEEYPKYYFDALSAMQEILLERSGINDDVQKEILEGQIREEISKIEADNNRFHSLNELTQLEGLFSVVLRDHIAHIQAMRERAMQPDSQISPEQLENILMHMFMGQEALYSRANVGIEGIKGGIELCFLAGSLVSNLDDEIGRRLHTLGGEMYDRILSGESNYLLRRAFKVPYQLEVENPRIYWALARNQQEREMKDGRLSLKPKYEFPVSSFEDNDGNIFSPEEVRDWLLSPPLTKATN